MYQRPVVDASAANASARAAPSPGSGRWRQVGKTTAAEQVVERLARPHVFAAADTPLPPARNGSRRNGGGTHPWARHGAAVVLVLDEIQRCAVDEQVKRLWDEDRRRKHSLHVLLLGSSSLLLQQDSRRVWPGASSSTGAPTGPGRSAERHWVEPGAVAVLRGYPGAAPLPIGPAIGGSTWPIR